MVGHRQQRLPLLLSGVTAMSLLAESPYTRDHPARSEHGSGKSRKGRDYDEHRPNDQHTRMMVSLRGKDNGPRTASTRRAAG
jgi:hypothetical protein